MVLRYIYYNRKIYGCQDNAVKITYNIAMDIFALRLRENRKFCGYTQQQLAKAIGTTDDSIYSWEKGRSQPSIEYLRALCRVFDVTADYLIGLEDETGTKIKE